MPNGQVEAITLVPESQLAREQAEGGNAVETPRSAASPMTIASLTNLAAVGLLTASWFLMTAVSIQPAFSESLEFTFWQLLGFLHAGHLSSPLDVRNNPGLYGFLALAALAGPLLPRLWKDKRALRGGLLPLAFMSVAAIAVRRATSNRYHRAE